jgi:hypothetical protein
MHVRGKGQLAALLAWPPFMQNCKRKQSAFLHWFSVQTQRFGGMLPLFLFILSFFHITWLLMDILNLMKLVGDDL